MSLLKTLPVFLLLGLCLMLLPAVSLAQCGTLADPGFENPPLGVFENVVSPTFSAGFWGDENAGIVASGACAGVAPYAGNSMLEMVPNAGNNTEIWQAVAVGPNAAGSVSVSAYFTACEGRTPTAAINVKTFNRDTGWPNSTSMNSTSMVLDGSAATWEQLTLECVDIPEDTVWILIDLNFVNDGLVGQNGYVDEVALLCGCEVVPTYDTSWSGVKALYR